MEFSVEKAPSYKQFMQNMEQKMQDVEFLGDMDLLIRPNTEKFDPKRAFEMIKETFIDKMAGRRKCQRLASIEN